MKKIIIKLIVVAFIGTLGGLYYVWQEATKIPDEYTQANSSDPIDSQSLPLKPSQITERATVSKQKLTAPIDRARVGQKVTVKLNDRDLNNLVVANLAASQPTKQIPVGIKGIKTKIEAGKVYAGAMVNLDKLAQNGQSAGRSAALKKLTDKLTFLKERDVYIGISGKPIVNGSKIELEPNTQIKVGNMKFTIAQLAETLAVSPDKIQQAISVQLQQPNFKVDRINLDNNGLAIEGAKK
jgi:hypothetical protein